jgi:hypothetical protein
MDQGEARGAEAMQRIHLEVPPDCTIRARHEGRSSIVLVEVLWPTGATHDTVVLHCSDEGEAAFIACDLSHPASVSDDSAVIAKEDLAQLYMRLQAQAVDIRALQGKLEAAYGALSL